MMASSSGGHNYLSCLLLLLIASAMQYKLHAIIDAEIIIVMLLYQFKIVHKRIRVGLPCSFT